MESSLADIEVVVHSHDVPEKVAARPIGVQKAKDTDRCNIGQSFLLLFLPDGRKTFIGYFSLGRIESVDGRLPLGCFGGCLLTQLKDRLGLKLRS